MLIVYTQCHFTNQALKHIYARCQRSQHSSKKLLMVDCDFFYRTSDVIKVLYPHMLSENTSVILFCRNRKDVNMALHRLAVIDINAPLTEWKRIIEMTSSKPGDINVVYQKIEHHLVPLPKSSRRGITLNKTLQLVSEGYSIKEIANQLNKSVSTVYGYTKLIMNAYGFPSLAFLYLNSGSIANKKRQIRPRYR